LLYIRLFQYQADHERNRIERLTLKSNTSDTQVHLSNGLRRRFCEICAVHIQHTVCGKTLGSQEICT